MPPGRCVVLLTECERAVWITSWPYAEYVKHAWGGAWVNSLFRNEGAGLSSELVREALAVTRFMWPYVPRLGLVTFVDAGKTKPKRDPGYCYLKAGFHHAGMTKGGLYVRRIYEEEMPDVEPPVGISSSVVAEESNVVVLRAKP